KLIENNMVELAGSDLHNMNYLEALRKSRYERSLRDLIGSGRLINDKM
ncbi:MAG: hypothetical protein IH598_04395, partial [Bacteroidales bacterium]|nr:hypothetical protein [Bacteroidales bacterium]